MKRVCSMIDTIRKIEKNLDELIKLGTPLYVYDFDILKERSLEMKQFKETLEKDMNGIIVNIHYSPKANGNPAILKAVKDAGLYVDSMSPLELSICQKSH